MCTTTAKVNVAHFCRMQQFIHRRIYQRLDNSVFHNFLSLECRDGCVAVEAKEIARVHARTRAHTKCCSLNLEHEHVQPLMRELN